MVPTLTRAHLVLAWFGLCFLTACDDSSASLDQDIDITRDDAGHGGNSGGKGGKGGGGGNGSTAKGGSGGSNASSGKPSSGSGGAGGASAGSGGAAANGGSGGASAGASGARTGAGAAAGPVGAGSGGRSGMGGSSVSIAGVSGRAVAGSGGVVALAGAGASAAGHAGAAGVAGGGGSAVVRSGPCASCESDSIAMSCPESLSDCATLSGTTAANSPMPGVAKAALCQMILDCFHTTHCAAQFSPTDCLCGAGVTADACMMSTSFAAAKGMCKDLIAAGAETTDMAMIQARMIGKMYALGPAIAVLQNCDYMSCTKECL